MKNEFVIEEKRLKKYEGNEKKIIIPDGVDRIGCCAFMDCKSIESVEIPDGVKIIEDFAFERCDNLKSVVIEGDLESLGSGAFKNCKKLKSVSVTGTIEVIGSEAFRGCKSNQEFSFPSGLRLIGWSAFADCRSLEKISFPDTVEVIGERVFSGSGKIKSIICSNSIVEKLSIPGIEEEYLFADYKPDDLMKMVISRQIKRNKKKLIKRIIDENNPKALKKFLSEWKKIKKEQLEDYLDMATKAGSTEVASVLLQLANDGKDTNNKKAITDDLQLKEMTVSEWRKIFKFISENGGITITGYKGSEPEVTIPEKIGKNNVTAIGEKAFFENSFIKKVILSDSIKEIGQFAFERCPNLEFNEFEKGYYLGSTSNPYHAFVKPIYSFTPPVVWENVFSGSTKVIAADALSGNSSIEELILPDEVEVIGPLTFSNCRNLKTIKIPEKVNKIGERAFVNCVSLKEINLPSHLTMVSYQLFDNCSSLTEITIPDYVESIEMGAFRECIALKDVSIPKSVKEIGKMAFQNCPEVTIHSSKGSTAEQYALVNDIPFIEFK